MFEQKTIISFIRCNPEILNKRLVFTSSLLNMLVPFN